MAKIVKYRVFFISDDNQKIWGWFYPNGLPSSKYYKYTYRNPGITTIWNDTEESRAWTARDTIDAFLNKEKDNWFISHLFYEDW